MEGRGGAVSSSGGVTVLGSDAPSEYHVAPRPENPIQVPISTASPVESFKKKRGRPRKYAPDGSPNVVLSPKPISSAAPEPAPAVIDFSSPKRGKVKPTGSFSKPSFEKSLGESVACTVGANFMPHIITVNTGEDVTMKIISFSQQGPRSICILSASGTVSSVTLRQPDSCGGTLTYEGRFEILSLTGSFTPNESGGTRSRSGGMSVSLSSPDGRVIGGGVAGLLVAAGPIQIVVGSFISGNEHEEKPKKKKHDTIPSVASAAAVPVSPESKQNFSTSQTFRADNWSSVAPDLRNKQTDINVSLP